MGLLWEMYEYAVYPCHNHSTPKGRFNEKFVQSKCKGVDVRTVLNISQPNLSINIIMIILFMFT